MAAHMEVEDVDSALKEEEDIEEVELSSGSAKSEGDSSDEDAAIDRKIEELKSQLLENPYLYDNHVQLIKLLKQTGELQDLRDARQKMSELFPLTEDLWLDWFQDEIPLASTQEEKDILSKLFDRATKDYLSVPVWLEYVQFSIGNMGQENGLQKVRTVFEQAITATGLHVTQGTSIWEAYREFEMAVYSGLQPAPGAVTTKEQEDQMEAQNNRIINLFKRQLGIPLMDMEETFEEYRQWISGDVDNYVKQSFQNASAKLKEILAHEEALMMSDPPRLAEYQSYINFEVSNGDPARIQCVFERAIQENCLLPDMWSLYTKYLDTKLKISSVSVAVYERALRNCPWSVEIWLGYLRALERSGKTHDQMKGAMDKALAVGFTQGSDYLQLWMGYCDYSRRRISWEKEHSQELEDLRNTIMRAVDHIYQVFGQEGDPTCSLQQYWARIEAKFCKNMEKAREIWNDIMAAGFGNQAEMWLAYYNLERSYGTQKHCRKILQRAVNSASDWPESVCDAYINFEREEGTLEQYDTAVSKCADQLERVNERRIKAAEKEAETADKHKKERDTKKKTTKKQFSKQPPPQKKRKLDAESASQDTFKIPISPSVMKGPPPPGYKPKSDTFKAPLPPGDRGAPPPGWKGDGQPPAKKQKEMPDQERVAEIERDPSKNNQTVFVSNIAYSLEENKLTEIFSPCGDITEIRLVKNFSGKSKGFGYVEFKDQSSVEEALKLDRTPIDGRPMYVSPCEEKGMTHKQFKFSTGLEKSKLFVKGLPFTVTEEALNTTFSAHGKLKGVRLVTYRSGAPKGIAYVEYENEADAARAVLKTDGLQIGEHTISVAISNPPGRKPQAGQKQALFTPTLGGGKKETAERGKARTQLTLLPRSLQKTAPSSAEENNENKSTGQKMSNADFRSMLLRK